MSDYSTPTQQEFAAAEQTALSVVKAHNSELWTNAGSVLREIIIRPFAYLQSWWLLNRNADVLNASVATLKKSQATENSIADRVAANYFVTRRTANGGSGAVTIIMNLPSAQLSTSMSFDCSGTLLFPTESCYISTSADSALTGIRYIRSIPYSEDPTKYVAVIPVTATYATASEIPVGTEVTPNFSLAAIDSAFVSSAVTGGCGTETDAEMMARAETTVASGGIGSYYGIKKLLDTSPVSVMSMCVVAGEEKAMFRARYNNVNINPCGLLDVHVATQRQVSEGYEDFVQDEGESSTTFTIETGTDHPGEPGLIVVSGVTVDGVTATGYTVTYSAQDSSGLTADGARLSVNQVTTVTFTTAKTGTVRVSFIYMPGIAEIQDFLTSDSNRFLGQDVMAKAAVPMQIKVDCAYSADADPTDETLAKLRSAIASYINGLPVGTGTVVFSDMYAACKSVVPDISLRVPCLLRGSALLTTGAYDTFSSNTGTLDVTLSASATRWPDKLYYMYILDSDINLERTV